MYWKLPGWTKLSEHDSKELVDRMETHMAAVRSDAGKEPLFVYPPSDDGSLTRPGVSRQSDRLVVRQILRRRLPFYPTDWFIYRLICARPNRPDLEGYEDSASIFAIFQPQTVVLLDWTSPPIHSLNEQIGLDLSDTDAVADYLVFFCSYIGGDPGAGEAIAPFLLPQSQADLGWDERLEAFEEIAHDGDLKLLPNEVPDTKRDPFDLGNEHMREDDVAKAEPTASNDSRDKADEEKEEPNALGDRLGKKRLFEAVGAAFGEFDTNPTPWHDPDGNGEVRQFRALVWYEGTLFRSAFRVKMQGMVEMLDDEPVGEGTRLPAPLWQVQRLPSRISLLCRQRPREVIGSDDLVLRMQGKQRAESVDNVCNSDASAEITIRGLRINNDLRCSGKFSHRIVFDDIEFTGRIDLSDCTFERSLIISDCRFLYDLSIKDATVQGSFKLHRTTIEGAYRTPHETERPTLQPALAMDGLRVGRLLAADRLVVNGRLRARSLRVGGALRALGLRVRRREPEQAKPALDLGNARLEGPMDFSAHGHSAELRLSRQQVRTRVSGPANFDGLQAGEVILRGAHISGDLDLSACRIQGLLDLTPFTISDAEQLYWRTRIEGELNLRNGDCLEVRLSGARIGSHLLLVNAHVRSALFAALWRGYQTRISGHLVASGATLERGPELEGTRIAGELVFVTGRCGRLTAIVSPWWRPNRWPPEVTFEPVRASGIILSEVEFVAGANLTGLRLDGQMTNYSKGGIVTSSVRCGGQFNFWHTETEHILRQTALANWKTIIWPQLIPSINSAIKEVWADIAGDLDLRGIVLEGAACLGRLKVAGRLCIDSARIAGDLRTDDDLSCYAFSANATVVCGNADLRGIRVLNGGLTARGIRVDGTMLLTSPPEAEEEPALRYARFMKEDNPNILQEHAQWSSKSPSIDLDGSRASRLVISGNNVDHRSDNVEISLARGQFGQLTIVDFRRKSNGWRFPVSRSNKCSFPVRMRLSPIEVGDWQIKPEVEALPLLSSAEFDRGLYIEIERRLARIGMNRLANKIYRCMIWRNTREPQVSLRSWAWAGLNGLFSRQGTWPLLMAFWLVVSVLPTIAVFSLWQNIQFADQTRPQEEMAGYWNPLKGMGLAVSYAVPIFGGARAEQARARSFGPTCLPSWPAPSGRSDDAIAAQLETVPSEPPRPVGTTGVVIDCPGAEIDLLSPHDIALSLSFVQFGLWLMIAASLPAIIRRRN